MNYFYLERREKFSDIINGEVDYAYFVNPDNMAPIIINDMWNIYYNYVMKDKRFPAQVILDEMLYNDILTICGEINKDAIIAVTKHITPMLTNQFIFKPGDPKESNKTANAYLQARIALAMAFYGEMLSKFSEVPKGFNISEDLMTSTSYLKRYTLNELIQNNLINVKKYINNGLICSLTLNLSTIFLYKLLLDKKNPNVNITFSLPLTTTVLSNTNVNILILIRGMASTLNDFITKTTLNSALIIETPNKTVPVPAITDKNIAIFLQLSDIITSVNAAKKTSTKSPITTSGDSQKIATSDDSQKTVVAQGSQNVSNQNTIPIYVAYETQIIIVVILLFLFLCLCLISIVIYKKKQK